MKLTQITFLFGIELVCFQGPSFNHLDGLCELSFAYGDENHFVGLEQHAGTSGLHIGDHAVDADVEKYELRKLPWATETVDLRLPLPIVEKVIEVADVLNHFLCAIILGQLYSVFQTCLSPLSDSQSSITFEHFCSSYQSETLLAHAFIETKIANNLATRLRQCLSRANAAG